MVLRLFRDLLSMAFKVFFKKAFHDRETHQLVEAPLPPPQTTVGTEEPPPGACFKCGKVGHWEKNHLLPGPSTLHKQDPELIAPLCLEEVGQFFKFPLQRKVCGVAWA